MMIAIYVHHVSAHHIEDNHDFLDIIAFDLQVTTESSLGAWADYIRSWYVLSWNVFELTS